MSNEILLILSIFIIYGSVIVMYKLFGKQGLFCFTSIATIAANIEVLIMVKAFGMVMTLGNVLFASTFLITDIVSEVYGKKDAKRAVHIGITTSIVFIIFSQWWLLYTPDSTDFAMPAMQTIFSNTPRLMITSNGSTLISQFLNNILYTFGAFWGIHDFKTLISIAISSYVIFIVTSLADTPFVYLARRISKKIKE